MDCFKGQLNSDGNTYRIDPGVRGQQSLNNEDGHGFKNEELNISSQQILEKMFMRYKDTKTSR